MGKLNELRSEQLKEYRRINALAYPTYIIGIAALAVGIFGAICALLGSEFDCGDGLVLAGTAMAGATTVALFKGPAPSDNDSDDDDDLPDR